MRESIEHGSSSSKRSGVTRAIRTKLNFLDDRKWKRFSARRLEMIDTLDLSYKKASEQEADIHRVAEALRIEFNYPSDVFEEFDKLVRAAIQSVRRNRKRATKSKRGNTFRVKLQKTEFDSPEGFFGDEGSDEASEDEVEYKRKAKNQFSISDIAKFTSDSQDQMNEYSKSKNITDFDKSRVAIRSMVQPRIIKKNLIDIPKPSIKISVLNTNLNAIRAVLINYIERSKTCSEAISKPTPNLEALGRGIIIACVGFVFEKSFKTNNEESLEYLRGKLTSETYLATFYRELDRNLSERLQVNDTIAVTTLNTILGACINDFGFETIMMPLCELIYLNVIKEYPLMAENSITFKAIDYLKPSREIKPDPLSSLATIASDIRQQEQRSYTSHSSSPNIPRSSTTSPIEHIIKPERPDRKAVQVRFLSSVLNFSFPIANSATPKLDELLENARSAFHLSRFADSHVLGLKDLKDGRLVTCDLDLERIFATQNSVELEVFTQQPQAQVPIYEITSLVVPNNYSNEEKIILPPPLSRNGSKSTEPIPPVPRTSFKFLSNLEESKTSGPPAPVLPKFQPLL